MIAELKSKIDFKRFYTEHFSILVNFTFSKTKDWELSREIVQQTFVKLWMRRDKTEIKSSLKSYLFMMVKNAIIDHHRRNERFTEMENMPEMSTENSFSTDDEEVLYLRHAIRKALETMKPKRKMIFELSKFEGLTYAEIAAHLEISERAVEDNISKAIVQIREMLKFKEYT